jgi:hypothetical protein
MCVFYKLEDGDTTIIIVYVDDFLISARSRKKIDSLIDNLKKKYIAINASHGPIIEYLSMNLDFIAKKPIKSPPRPCHQQLMSFSKHVTFLSSIPKLNPR